MGGNLDISIFGNPGDMGRRFAADLANARSASVAVAFAKPSALSGGRAVAIRRRGRG